jgi:hypothetical protein
MDINSLALSCLALSCLVLLCLALSCLALPCLALPCLAVPCVCFASPVRRRGRRHQSVAGLRRGAPAAAIRCAQCNTRSCACACACVCVCVPCLLQCSNWILFLRYDLYSVRLPRLVLQTAITNSDNNLILNRLGEIIKYEPSQHNPFRVCFSPNHF